MNTVSKHILTSAALLALFAVIGTAIVSGLFELTASRIQANKEAVLLRQLASLVPTERFDNDILQDHLNVQAKELNPRGDVTVYLARQQQQPVAAVFKVTTVKGYNGSIELLVAVNWDESLAGVRVLTHKETPGLGDGIEAERTDWIQQFNLRSLNNPEEALWGVQRDGGYFDQLTGATITPRAVVQAVKATLLYFRDHKQSLFTPTDA